MGVSVINLKDGQKELIQSIIARLKSGEDGAFIKPWVDSGFDMSPRNAISGRPYGGWNRFATTFTAYVSGYKSNLWLTKKQIEDRHGQVLPIFDKEGKEIGKQKPTYIVFTGRYKKRSRSNGPETPTGTAELPMGEHGTLDSTPLPDRSIPLPMEGTESPVVRNPPETEIGRFVREYAVYNLDQTSGVKLPKKIEAMLAERDQKRLEWTPDASLGELRRVLTEANVAPIYFDRVGDCFYNPGEHAIHAPRKELFISELDMWEAIGHETIHATGAKHHLSRPSLINLKTRNSKLYAQEEIVAVMGSLFLCQQTGVKITPEREKSWTSYIRGYDALEFLEKNPAVFVQALVQAEFATNYVMHPELRPDFVKNRKSPDQVEFAFDEYSPAKTFFAEPVDGEKIAEEMAKIVGAADALERSAQAPGVAKDSGVDAPTPA